MFPVTLFRKFPKEIQLYIITFTYSFQHPSLLEDVRDYSKTRKLLDEYYEEEDWLINDIFGYMNSHEAILFGYTESFYTIIRRLLPNKTKKELNQCIMKIEEKEVTTQITILWGLLTVNEREQFITSLT